MRYQNNAVLEYVRGPHPNTILRDKIDQPMGRNPEAQPLHWGVCKAERLPRMERLPRFFFRVLQLGGGRLEKS